MVSIMENLNMKKKVIRHNIWKNLSTQSTQDIFIGNGLHPKTTMHQLPSGFDIHELIGNLQYREYCNILTNVILVALPLASFQSQSDQGVDGQLYFRALSNILD